MSDQTVKADTTCRVLVNCDYPKKASVVKVDLTSNFGTFLQQASKHLETNIDNYTFSIVSYGECVKEMNPKKEDVIGGLGMKEGSVVFCLAPASLKPLKKRIRKLKAKKEEKKEPTDEGDVSLLYKGFSVKNILTKLIESKDSTSTKKNRMFEYVEMFAQDIIKQSKFSQVPKPLLIQILKRDGLNLKEVDLFDAVLEWAKAECKRQDKQTSDENIKAVLEDIFPLIRFPTMELQDVAVKVERSKLLDSTQLLALFTYLGAKSSNNNVKLDPSLKNFNPKPRVPRQPFGVFVFDGDRKGAALVLSNNNKTVRQTYGTSQWNTIGTKQWLKKGVHIVKFRIDNDTHSHWIFLGVITRSFSAFNDTSSGYLGHASDSYGWSSGGTSSYLYPGSRTYGRAFRQGDVVEMTVDMDKNTISYRLNSETSFGVAFSAIPNEVCVAVTTYDTNDQVTLL